MIFSLSFNSFSTILKTKLIIKYDLFTPQFLESEKNLCKIEKKNEIRHLHIFPIFFSPNVKTDPKLPSRPTTKSGNRKGNSKIQIQNNSKPVPTVSILNSKVDGIDGKQECLEKFLLEHVCGINIVESWHDFFPFYFICFFYKPKTKQLILAYYEHFIPVS